MVRTDVTVEVVVPTGLLPTETPGIADGHQFINDGRTFVRARNSGAGAHDYTFLTPGTIGGVALLAVGDLVVNVLAAGEKLIGPFPKSVYDQSDGKVHVDYESVESESNVEVCTLPLT